LNYLVEVRDMTGYGEWLVVASSLPGLYDPKDIGQLAGHGRNGSPSAGATVDNHHDRT